MPRIERHITKSLNFPNKQDPSILVYNASADTGVVAGSDNLTSYLLGKRALFT